jgi:hypothetical protein
MSELNLHDSMVERAAKVLEETFGSAEIALEVAPEVAREVIKAAFEGVPMTNYAIGTLLGFFDLVIVVKDLDSRAAALVSRREAGRPASEGFETLGHDVTVNWKDKPTRYISGVAISKLDPPAA